MEREDAEEQIVEGADMPIFFNEHSRTLLARCGALVRKDGDERVDAKGTATFVRSGSDHFLMTAKHVVDDLGDHAVLMLPPLEAAGTPAVGRASPPVEMRVGAALFWESAAFDAALLRAPEFDRGVVGWFDLHACRETTQKLHNIWRNFISEEHSLPYAVCGYPEYGHLRDEDSKLELLAALPLFAYIEDWTHGPGHAVANSKTSSQIRVEAVAEPRNSDELAALPALEQHMAKRLKSSEVKNPFGGYSGGPVALFDLNGVHLIGSIKEGGWLFGVKAEFFVSPLDEVASAAGL